MPKSILIIGGGISGLSLLHYLKIKYYFQDDVNLLLLEENECLGGAIHTIRRNDCIFETGPNGFLDSKPRTLQLIKDLNLENSLLAADSQSKSRYVSARNRLHAVPMTPREFISSGILNPFDKVRFLLEIFAAKGNNPNESVYAFTQRHFGNKSAQVLVDPLVKGIFAGDAKQLIMKEIFPQIYQWEQEFGSLFKAMETMKKERQKEGKAAAGPGSLKSFQGGMSELIDALGKKYESNIRINEHVLSIQFEDNQFVVNSHGGQYKADQIFLSTPAHAAARLLEPLDKPLAQELNRIFYAPIAVIGLVFQTQNLKKIPAGFGYLIPSTEQNPVLGVLFENKIFHNRCRENQIFFRVMIGGAHFPEILKNPKDELMNMAIREIHKHFPVSEKPQETFYTSWPRAIPQYDIDYVQAKAQIVKLLGQYPHLHLVANYLNGVSVNDCIENAYQAVQNFSLAS